MGGETIKSFLVGLGFGVDEASLAKFNKSISNATVKVTALYASINALAAATVATISDVSEGFEKMGYEYHIIAPAINKALVLRRELLNAYKAAGINITEVIQSSVKLNMSLAKTKIAFQAVYQSVASKFFGLLTKQSDAFRQKLYQNMPKIQLALEKFVKFIFKAFEIVTQLGLRVWSILSRVYDFFVKLDKATDGWSTVILSVIAAWKLLNLEFFATPLGMIIAGLLAILALFDDFKTWQEGGQSLFDWSSFVPVINAVSAALSQMKSIIDGLFTALFNIGGALVDVFNGRWLSALDKVKEAFWGINQAVEGVFGTLHGVASTVEALGGWAANLFGSGNAQPNLANNPVGRPSANPVGSAVQNSNSNQHVAQQTQINVMGSADAQATGKAVAGEQAKVNFDMVRNLKGATR